MWGPMLNSPARQVPRALCLLPVCWRARRSLCRKALPAGTLPTCRLLLRWQPGLRCAVDNARPHGRGEVGAQPALVRGEGAGRRRAASSSGWSANVSEAVRRRTSAWEWLQQSCDSSRRRVSQAALNACAACSASFVGPAAWPTYRHRRGSRTRRSRTTPGTCNPASRAAAVPAAVGLIGRKSKSVHSCARPLICQPPC